MNHSCQPKPNYEIEYKPHAYKAPGPPQQGRVSSAGRDHPNTGNNNNAMCQVNATYRMSVNANVSKTDWKWAALVDRGANGTLTGRDMRLVAWTDHHNDLSGVDSHTVRNLRIGTFGAVVESD